MCLLGTGKFKGKDSMEQFEKGKMDFQQGVNYEDNPYEQNTRGFVLWIEGWLTARSSRQG